MKDSDISVGTKIAKTWFCDIYVTFSKNTFQIVSYDLCPKDVSFLAERFVSLKPGVVESLIFNRSSGFTFNNVSSYNSDDSYNSDKFFNLREFAISSGFVEDENEYVSLLNSVFVNYSNYKISQSITEDKKIIQAIEALDDLNESINLLSERLRGWFSVYSPNTDLLGEDYAKFVVSETSLLSENSENPIETNYSESAAAPLSFEEAKLICSFAEDICRLYERRSVLESYIFTKMQTVAPTLSSVAGESLGARLISMAGSLKRLSSLPSSTVQVMGADKSLFKHLRSRASSPKHGIIFNHNFISNSPPLIRGKIARTLASHISLAARVDYYSKVYKPEILESLNLKFQEITENYKTQKATQNMRSSNSKINSKDNKSVKSARRK